MRYVILIILSCFVLTGAEIDWDKARTVQTGVKLIRLENNEPRLQKINLMRIDLRTEGLRFTATARDPGWGKPMPDHDKFIIHTRRTRTRDFMLETRKKGLDVIVAVNAAPWEPWEKPFDHKFAQIHGLNITGGEVIADAKPHRATFVVYQNGKADITASVPEKDYRELQVAAAGFSIILKDGKIVAGAGPQLAPRTAYGLSKDRHYLYIVTVDGRQQDWSMGATIRETAQLLQDAGSYDGLNMDGGGSTTLYYWDAKESKPVSLNRHGDKGYERPVANSIAIYLAK